MNTQIDHLVVMASTLEAGVAWCEATLGITPSAGGEHEKYGTHHRLFKIASPKHPLAYFEIIAIDPEAPATSRTRWFGLDDAGDVLTVDYRQETGGLVGVRVELCFGDQ